MQMFFRGKFFGGLALSLSLVVAIAPAVRAQAGSGTSHDVAPDRLDTFFTYRLLADTGQPARVEMEIEGTGKGNMRFNLWQGAPESRYSFTVKPATIADLAPLFDALDFFNSGQAFQSQKDMPQLGTTTIGFRRGHQERRVSFNNTDSDVMMQIRDRLKSIARQEYHACLLEHAVHEVPGAVPHQLSDISEYVEDGELPEPEDFLPLLTEIAASQQMSAEAKKQAGDLMKVIQGGK